MTRTTSPTARLGDRLLDLDNPVYGDERERTVVLQASSLAFLVMNYVFMGFAVIFAATGAPIIGFVMLLLGALQALVAARYAKSKGVDYQELVAQYAPQAGRRATVISWVALALFALASFYWVNTGHGLLPVDWTPEIWPGGRGGGALKGALIGMIVGGALGGLWGAVSRRRKKTPAAETDPD